VLHFDLFITTVYPQSVQVSHFRERVVVDVFKVAKAHTPDKDKEKS